MKTCPQCSASNDDGQKFCLQCGSDLLGELEKFLSESGLTALLPILESNDIRELEQLKMLSPEDLRELQGAGGGRMVYGDVIKLRKALEELQKHVMVQLPPVPQESRLETLHRQAGEGDLSAMFELGNLYFAGTAEVPQDLALGVSWYRKAADKGHPGGQCRYGEALFFGRGIAEDEKESARWLRLASRQGHAEAKERYNARVDEGRFAYLLDSADQGNAESQFRLGGIFYKGDQGHPVDKAQAAVWLRKASIQGIGAAQFLLGKMHLQGDGIRQDQGEARRLLESASAQGITEASELLASLPEQTPSHVSSAIPAPVVAEPPKKKGRSLWQIFVGIAITLIVIGRILALFVPDNKKSEESPSPTPQSSGASTTFSNAGILSLTTPTPVPVVAATPEPTPPPRPISTPLLPLSRMPSAQASSLGSSFANSLGHRFVPIPGTVAYFDIWDVRVADYQRFINETGRFWKPAGFPQQADHPAVRVNYYDATAFCQWLTQREHASGLLPLGYEYRLPSDLEWSAAVGIGEELEGPPAWRGGGIPGCYSWGGSWPPPPGCGNYDPKMKTDRFAYTSPVGAFAANRFGLYDMNGNAYQWILEDFDQNGDGCLRGGSWADEEEESINISNRFPAAKDTQGKCFGFRCVIAPLNTVSDIQTAKLPQ